MDGARRADELAARRAALAERARAMGAWAAAFTPPTPAESLAWQRTQAATEKLMALSADRLAAARTVAERAQAAGIRDARLGFLAPDSLETDPPMVDLDAPLFPGALLLSVEVNADLRALSRFLGSLPPGFVAWQVRVRREGSRARTRVLLVSYVPTQIPSDASGGPPR